MNFLEKVIVFHNNLKEEEKKLQAKPDVIHDDKEIQEIEKKPRKKSLQQIFIIRNNYKKKK